MYRIIQASRNTLISGNIMWEPEETFEILNTLVQCMAPGSDEKDANENIYNYHTLEGQFLS